MKKAILFILLIIFSLSTVVVAAENQKQILHKLVVQKHPRTIKSKLDSVVFAKWQNYEYKFLSNHTLKFEDLRFKPEKDSTNDIISIKSSDYYIGSFIPSNTKRINNFDTVKAYTLFNVVYYIEKDYTKQWITMGLSALGVVVPTVMTFSYYNNYDKTTSSSDAKSYRNATNASFAVSIIGLGNLAYQFYRYYL